MKGSIAGICLAAVLVLCTAASASAKEPVFPGHEPEFVWHPIEPPTIEVDGLLYRSIAVQKWLREVNEFNKEKDKLTGMVPPEAIQFEDPVAPPKEATFKWASDAPWAITLGVSGKGKITGEVEKVIGFTMEFREGPTCTYETGKITLNYAIAPQPVPWEPAVSKQKFKLAKGSGEACAKTAVYSAAFNVTTVEPEEQVLIEK